MPPPPPPCNLGKRFENTNSRRKFFWGSSPNFGPKTGLNLSEDLFLFVCYALHLTFDRKNGLIVDVKIFIQDFLILRFSESPAPPPFQNPAYATGYHLLSVCAWSTMRGIRSRAFLCSTTSKLAHLGLFTTHSPQF